MIRKSKNKNAIKIGSKQTQFFQKCPKCSIHIRVPRERNKIPHTPYYNWKFKDRVECPNCGTPDELGFGLLLPTKVNVKNPPKIKKKNDCLYACDIGIIDYTPPIDHFLAVRTKGESTFNYLAIFEDGVQFLQSISFSNWKDNKKFKNLHHGYFPDGWCSVYTNVDFNGNIETGIEV